MSEKYILQIDDDEDDCFLFRDAVAESCNIGYKYLHNAEEALENLVSGDLCPEVIILDINMPIMTGYEFLEKLCNYTTLDKIPVYIFSTYALPSGNDVDQRVKKFINKPICFKELKTIVRDLAQSNQLI